MNKLTAFFLGMFIFITVQSYAQDRIYKKNGEIIEAKVSQISVESITFKRFENLEGPEYSVPKADVMKIKYSNGSQDIFEENNDKIGVNDKGKSIAAKKYMDSRDEPRNKNIIAAAPLQFTENGYGFSFSYERTLDKRGWVSFYCPAIYTFNQQTEYGQTVNTLANPMFYLMPGIKFYTNLNSSNRVKKALSVSMVLAAGSGVNNNTVVNNNGYYGYENPVQSRFLMGAIATYGGNMFPTEHLYIGWDFGIGMSYANQYEGRSYGTTALVELSLKVGYRWSRKVK